MCGISVSKYTCIQYELEICIKQHLNWEVTRLIIMRPMCMPTTPIQGSWARQNWHVYFGKVVSPSRCFSRVLLKNKVKSAINIWKIWCWLVVVTFRTQHKSAFPDISSLVWANFQNDTAIWIMSNELTSLVGSKLSVMKISVINDGFKVWNCILAFKNKSRPNFPKKIQNLQSQTVKIYPSF